MFSQYDIPIRIEQEGITVSVQKEGENILYMRERLAGRRCFHPLSLGLFSAHAAENPKRED